MTISNNLFGSVNYELSTKAPDVTPRALVSKGYWFF